MNHGGVTRARSLWGLLGTLAFAWSAAAAGQQLGSALEHSAWAVRGDNQACVLEHAVLGYATGRFRHEAGADRTFGLVSDDLRFDVARSSSRPSRRRGVPTWLGRVSLI